MDFLWSTKTFKSCENDITKDVFRSFNSQWFQTCLHLQMSLTHFFFTAFVKGAVFSQENIVSKNNLKKVLKQTSERHLFTHLGLHVFKAFWESHHCSMGSILQMVLFSKRLMCLQSPAGNEVASWRISLKWDSNLV